MAQLFFAPKKPTKQNQETIRLGFKIDIPSGDILSI